MISVLNIIADIIRCLFVSLVPEDRISFRMDIYARLIDTVFDLFELPNIRQSKQI